MKETLLTRKDDNLGDGLFDSIAWAFSEHVKAPDNEEYKSAILYGNEDCPEMIDFYTRAGARRRSGRLLGSLGKRRGRRSNGTSPDPLITDPVAMRWTR